MPHYTENIWCYFLTLLLPPPPLPLLLLPLLSVHQSTEQAGKYHWEHKPAQPLGRLIAPPTKLSKNSEL
jgi:hypothetical protein